MSKVIDALDNQFLSLTIRAFQCVCDLILVISHLRFLWSKFWKNKTEPCFKVTDFQSETAKKIKMKWRTGIAKARKSFLV